MDQLRLLLIAFLVSPLNNQGKTSFKNTQRDSKLPEVWLQLVVSFNFKPQFVHYCNKERDDFCDALARISLLKKR